MQSISTQSNQEAFSQLQKYCSTLEKENIARNEERIVLHKYVEQLLEEIAELKKYLEISKIEIENLSQLTQKYEKEQHKTRNEHFQIQQKLYSLLTEFFSSQNSQDKTIQGNQQFSFSRKSNQRGTEQVIEINFKKGLEKFKQKMEEKAQKKFQNIALKLRQQMAKELNHAEEKCLHFQNQWQKQRELNKKLNKSIKEYQQQNQISKGLLREEKEKLVKSLNRDQFNPELDQILVNQEISGKILGFLKKRQDNIQEFKKQIQLKNSLIEKLQTNLKLLQIREHSQDAQKSITRMQIEEFLEFVHINMLQFETIQKERQEYRQKVMILEESNKSLRTNISKNIDQILQKDPNDDLGFIIEVKRTNNKFDIQKLKSTSLATTFSSRTVSSKIDI